MLLVASEENLKPVSPYWDVENFTDGDKIDPAFTLGPVPVLEYGSTGLSDSYDWGGLSAKEHKAFHQN